PRSKSHESGCRGVFFGSIMGARKFYLALLQLSVTTNKSENLRNAWIHVKRAASSGAEVICMSPTFGYSSDTLKNLKLYAETIPGETSDMLSSIARKNGIYLVGVAVGLSQEVRFAPLAHIYADLGCKLLVFPGSFNTALNPLRWDLLQRARAIDNQIYVASVSAARTQDAPYGSCGRSMLIDPQGDVVQSAGHDEAVVMAEVDLDHLSSVRKETPIRKHHRHDLYAVVNRQRNEDDREFFKNVFFV
ncbi:hypothetical protein HPB47_015078, partial [Ixodes persulcatus]